MQLGGRPMEEWVARYATSHQHPINRLCHTLGIPLEFLHDWRFLFVGLRWWIAKMRRRA